MSDLMTYVYGVTRADEALAERLTALEGVVDAPVHLISDGNGLALVASSVRAEDFREEALRRRLEDLDWLSAVARAHHGVVEAVAAYTTVLPLRLATVYLDDARAREVLDAGRELFTDRLARLAGHVEWGVKLYVDPSAAPEPPPAPADAELTPGRSYLRGRRQQQRHRDTAHQAAQRAAEGVEAAGRAFASERARHRVQQGTLAEAAGENVVNDAYLVPVEQGEAFCAEVRRAADGLAGVRVEITGPWAPYSFAMGPEETGGAAGAGP
ncbi:gas vesicle protein [Streptomyces seoulensis]|uniref:Gas vesicle protein n=1 Tax=Streptomyces seoulensis TaxID=73044 RepID=A0A4P6TZY0_STRSO|nr:GvpL/GvpF family gas vesicle protein [Streptomyces seoulensis]QBJ93365.1 gas vesicle protein [Streptomyces seoulensis]